ncbi:MAG: hypothetical protein R3346_04420 [Candidatus Spechtbacterales bacterium]|nr:hypothetical protein [Candidatus Spechtbacterales bacterium]
MEFISEYYSWIRFAHVAGAIIALGAVTATDFIMLWFKIKPKSMGPIVARVAPLLSIQVWIGLLLLSVSGLLMFIPMEGLESTDIFQLKMLLVLALFLNGIFLNLWVTPRFEKLIPEWEEMTPRVKKFMAIAGIATIVSFLSWWGVIFIMTVLY